MAGYFVPPNGDWNGDHRKSRELRAKAEAALLAAQELSNHATELQGCHLGTISLGINCGPDHRRVPNLIGEMWATCPGVGLTFVQGSSGRIAEDLVREVLDCGFLFGQGLATLIAHRLTTADLLVAAPKEWETTIKAASWEEVAGLPWIHSGGNCPFQLIIDGKFAERGLKPRKGVYADDDATRIDLLASGAGMAILQSADAMRAVDAGQAVIWPTELMDCDLSSAYLAGRKDDPLIKSMRIAVAREWEPVSDI
ncbi:MAG: substrate-binding domain-containing protein [Mesorhizobium sp.]